MIPPLVSVVLPVRNGERFVAEAVRSVLEQAWRPLELLVIEGGSTDGTRDVLAGFHAPELRVLDQEGRGIPGAWNQGIRSARGPVVAFLSSDDVWTPDKLARQVPLLLSQPDVLYTIARFRYFVAEGCDLPAGFNPALLGRDLVGRIMETLVARREAFEVVGMLDTAYSTAHDVDWYARANALCVPMRILDEVLLHKRVHDENASAQATVNTPQLMDVLHRAVRRRKEAS